ncbi:T9SS type A sorting domain-containing protein [Tenacibaculum tangerinum]|uniref:T9SS type A sorting domain-containing protein n=1 Tax=Tenacibaculum tangerinum TaxID=3038772 RepID=A0ABY8L4U1_9FLAO|nr:T9SS type A sorting domain-containing protein [Tenacibaculum tangerinum]WGH75363.1 T9SS type A sorting domain-containing protein [Tenacibaculum tangerinum]
MKNLSFICALLVSCMLTAQTVTNNTWKDQINPIFQGLDKSKVPHAILLDYAMEFTNVPAYNGTLTDSTYISTNVLGSIYKTLFMGKATTSTQYFPKLETVASTWSTARQNYNQTDKSTLVLAGLYYQYATLNPNALNTNKITVSNNKYYDKYSNGVWQNPYLTKQTIAYAPPVNTYNKRSFGVVLPQNLWLSNSASNIQTIQVNFNDGAGYKTLTLGQKIYANYTQNGTYDWVFKTTLTNGAVLYTRTKIKIEAPETDSNGLNKMTNHENNVVISGPNSSFPSWANGAVLRIDYAPAHNGQLTNPFIVAEGFDAGSILTPEVEGGDKTLNDFLNANNSLPRSDNLRNLLLFDSTQEYDIVYIDWQNGTNSIQHNSEVLKNVLAWVNSNKVGSEPNVLLGQSMGGVIGRYTLAKMEADGIAHNVRLFVAHDAPLQGANTPLSFQYFSRHAYDQYTSAPVLYGLVEVVIPTVLNLVELMSLGNLDVAFPSVEDYLTIQDTPAAMQMNYHYVDYNSNPTMAIHNAWQQEFESVGYPTQSRNIAISNGNECAVDHGFAPRAKFINLHDTHNPGFWGDLVHLLATPLAGALTGDIELTFLGLLPGSSKYFFDFDLYANPDVNASNRQVYNGKMRYEKKLLWLIPISHTITKRSKDAPSGYLPFDTYSGGFFDFVDTISFDFEQYLPSGTIVNSRYGFIPVVSALDIKRNNGDVDPTDYHKNYSGGSTPEPALTTGFDNFIVDFMPDTPNNNAHISFQPRNGNWLANELNEAAGLIENCAEFCGNTLITGNNNLCGSGTYSLGTTTTPFWHISGGNSLVTLSLNGTSVTLTQTNTSASGLVTLNANISKTGCGERTVSKEIWVGKPNITTTLEPNVNYVTVYLVGANGTNINEQGITTTTWEKVSGSGGCYASFSGSGFQGLAHGNCTSWNVYAKITATNACGTTTIYRNITPPEPGCEDNFRFAQNPMKSGNSVNRIIIDPCDGTYRTSNTNKARNYQIDIHNSYGEKIYSKTQTATEFDISSLKSGFYIVRFQTTSMKVVSKKLIIE